MWGHLHWDWIVYFSIYWLIGLNCLECWWCKKHSIYFYASSALEWMRLCRSPAPTIQATSFPLSGWLNCGILSKGPHHSGEEEFGRSIQTYASCPCEVSLALAQTQRRKLNWRSDNHLDQEKCLGMFQTQSFTYPWVTNLPEMLIIHKMPYKMYTCGIFCPHYNQAKESFLIGIVLLAFAMKISFRRLCGRSYCWESKRDFSCLWPASFSPSNYTYRSSDNDIIKGSLVEKLPSCGDLKIATTAQ